MIAQVGTGDQAPAAVIGGQAANSPAPGADRIPHGKGEQGKGKAHRGAGQGQGLGPKGGAGGAGQSPKTINLDAAGEVGDPDAAPARPCGICGGRQYWRRPWANTGGWLCNRCHPCPVPGVELLEVASA